MREIAETEMRAANVTVRYRDNGEERTSVFLFNGEGHAARYFWGRHVIYEVVSITPASDDQFFSPLRMSFRKEEEETK